VEVTSAASGMYQIFHHTKPSAPAITLASGIAEIRPNVPFRVRVINPTNRAHSLSKGMVIGIAAPAPARVFSLDAHGAKFCEPPQGYGRRSSDGLDLTDPERELSQSRRTSGTLMPPKGSHEPVWREKFCESRAAVATLEMGPEDLHEGKAESAKKEHKKKPRPQSARKTLPHGRTRSISRTYLPMNGSKYSACWSHITACGTVAWERWPPRLTESRSSPVPSPYIQPYRADPIRGSLKRPK
jgi:hypothetical protein